MNRSIQITIDDIRAEANDNETILEVANRIGIHIPTLCYLSGKSRLESCGICVVEIEGRNQTVPACASRVQPGMVIHTNTETLRETRRITLELLLSDHLGDCHATCEIACPANIEIPEFIRQIRYGHPEKALEVIQQSIAFTGALGRICPKFCEEVCRRGHYESPVSICHLKRYPADQIRQAHQTITTSKFPASDKKVAIVGAGIVGLTAAYFLLQQGHHCVLFESEPRLGGALRNIIPDFRLPSTVVEEEINHILNLGAEYHCNQTLGKNLSLEDLRQKHDAVLVAIGASLEHFPDIIGAEHAKPCYSFLHEASYQQYPIIHGTVLVYGTGATALDTARTLLRIGAQEVILAFPPSVHTRLFFSPFVRYGIAEGVVIRDESTLLSIEAVNTDQYCCKIERNQIVTDTVINFVFLSGNMGPDLQLLASQGLKTTKQGIQIDRRHLTTNIPGVFAAGSIAQAGRYAVHGSAAGKKVAGLINAFLNGEPYREYNPIHVRMAHLTEHERSILWRSQVYHPRIEERTHSPIQNQPSFEEVVQGITSEEARQETERCMQCDCAKKKNCLLRDRATEYEANPRAFKGEKPAYDIDDSHPEILYEPGKCIKCGRCLAIAEEFEEPLGLSYIGRGFKVVVGVPLNGKIVDGLTKAALACAENCPTGAISKRR